MKFLQPKPQVRHMNINYYVIYYTVNKNRGDKEIVDDKYEIENFNSFVFNIPNHKPRETILM